MDKSWLSKARVSTAYRNGVESFLNFAFAKSAEGNEILCPCVKCKNMFWQTRNVVNEHLICHGFVKKYSIWTFHGEKEVEDSDNDDMVEDDDMYGLLSDLAATVGGEPDGQTKNFFTLLEVADKELYPGCEKFSKLSFTIRIYLLKCLNGWSNSSFGDKLCSLVEEKFKSNCSEKLRSFIFKKMKKSYSTTLYNLRKKFQEMDQNERESYVPDGIDKEDWKQAVVNWGSELFKKKSVRNKKNRSQVKVKNVCGSRSHDEFEFNMIDPKTGIKKSVDEVWRAQHMKKNEEGEMIWCDEASKAIYERIKEIVNQGTYLSNKEIILKAKGKLSSRRVRREKIAVVGEEVRAGIRNEIYSELNQQFEARLAEQNKKWEQRFADLQKQHDEDMMQLLRPKK
ncbi:unnamed protein product, partial [Linum tenue]